ncbi:csn6 [Symbiodinium sp. KB8]|nr:csn6 [Symbiodinium sp. KB8]
MASESKVSPDDTGAAGTAQAVSLHPMALLGVADHHTRLQAGQAPGHTRAVGVLFGTQSEDSVDIILTADSLVSLEEGKAGFNLPLTKKHVEIVADVYPTYEVLGWYAVCPNGRPSEEDFAFHSQVKAMTEAPLFLCLDAAPATVDTAKDLPIALFMSEFVSGAESWIPVPYKVDALEAESLTIEAVVGAGQRRGETDSDVNPHLEGSLKAVRIARERMHIVREYVRAVKEGRVEGDRELLRLCRAVGNQLPAADSAAFHTAFTEEVTDSQVIAMLSAMTRAVDTANTAFDKLGLALQSSSAARLASGGPSAFH